MYAFISMIIIISTIKSCTTNDVCQTLTCACSDNRKTVHCDNKNLNNLNDLDFPPNVNTLSFVTNHLNFDTEDDIAKINNLSNLIDLNLKQNPLGKIPAFNNTKLQFLSLRDTSLTSALFPFSYNNCLLHTISLNDNKIRSINENDFFALRNSKLDKLNLDSGSISTIDRNAFNVLKNLQSLSLTQNQLKSAEFLSNIAQLSSYAPSHAQTHSTAEGIYAADGSQTGGSAIENALIVLLILIGVIHSEVHNVCDICTCDHLEAPMIVHCDGKNLTTLSDIMFNSTIEVLSLNNNSLTFKSVADLDKINNITSLKTLTLSNNPLSTIPELSLSNLTDLQLENTSLNNATFPKSYSNCTNLQSIILSNNKLMKITSNDLKVISSLTDLKIDNAELTSIEFDTFINISQNLRSISFESNSLDSAKFLLPIRNLRSINFDKNHFKQLPIEIIKMNQSKHFLFRDNQISVINESSPLSFWAKTNLSDIEIYLNNNPFDCCESRWFIRYLSESKNLIKDSMNLTCALPKAYTGKRLVDLRVESMDCSTDPFHPSKAHISKLAILIASLFSIVVFILIVAGATIYRRNQVYVRNRRGYQQIHGVNADA
ncbi:hypothetical protein I4U23_028216 [Adineta vaga]|nr:hypothetical protein I4U23_028216 [Adineta vaga]